MGLMLRVEVEDGYLVMVELPLKDASELPRRAILAQRIVRIQDLRRMRILGYSL